GALGIGVLWALWQNRAVGFLGACFFLALAPSSSFIPVATQTMAEHRMYLALAPLVVAVCVAARRLFIVLPRAQLPQSLIIATTMVIVALGAATFARNQVYRSELTL